MIRSKKPIQVEVRPRPNEPTERLIRRFVKKVKKEGILDEVRDRMYYEKPSVKKARQKRQRKRVMEKLKKEKILERCLPLLLIPMMQRTLMTR